MICIHEGPSEFDGTKIRAYLYAHENSKTNTSVGLTIAPADAVNYFDVRRSGGDVAVCGSCPARAPSSGGDGSCYVGNGSRIGLSLRGMLAKGINLPVDGTVEDIRYLLKHLRIEQLRSSVWGDAAALPPDVWGNVEEAAKMRDVAILGYTHGWTSLGFDRIVHLRATHVASVETPLQRLQAKAAGWRTFRVSRIGERPLQGEEFHCPAALERGHKTQCSSCMACGSVGNEQERRDALIWVHNTAGRRDTQKHLTANNTRLTYT